MRRCLNTATFGKKAFQCFRGVRQPDFVFADEQSMHEFLSLSEENKAVFTTTYTALSSTVTRNLNVVWGIDEHFSGSYYDDYKIIKNDHESCPYRTAWKDKYTTAIYALDSHVYGVGQYDLQPLPDYIRWKETGELHYIPFNERVLLDKGDWDNCPGLFLPTRVLNLCFAVVPHPTDDCLKEISKLAWIPLSLCKDYYEKQCSHWKDVLVNDTLKEKWKTVCAHKVTARGAMQE